MKGNTNKHTSSLRTTKVLIEEDYVGLWKTTIQVPSLEIIDMLKTSFSGPFQAVEVSVKQNTQRFERLKQVFPLSIVTVFTYNKVQGLICYRKLFQVSIGPFLLHNSHRVEPYTRITSLCNYSSTLCLNNEPLIVLTAHCVLRFNCSIGSSIALKT